MRKSAKKTKEQQIAIERIYILLENAKKLFKEDPETAKNYVRRLRRIAMHYRVRLPREVKYSFCKKCNSILLPGYNAVVRLTHKGYVAVKCSSCGWERHIFLKQKSKNK